MGYYWDAVEEKWPPIDHDRVLSQSERLTIERRGELIEQLLMEMHRPASGPTRLYASLLARALVGSDEELARRYSGEVAVATTEQG